MSRVLPLIWTLVVGGSISLLASGGHSFGIARSHSLQADHRRQTLHRQAEELVSLQSALPPWAMQAPTQGLAPRVSDSLATCGLPPTVMQNLVSQPGVSVNGTTGAAIKRRTASVTLSPLTLPELGRFLESWHAREPGWIVAAIDLTPLTAASPATENAGPGDAAALVRAVLSIEALYVEQTGATP